jgi:Pyruvate/2-oxoacid:ferredoxin oxidoreductase delta subunit
MTCFECELECPSRAINVHPFKEEFPTIDYSRFA